MWNRKFLLITMACMVVASIVIMIEVSRKQQRQETEVMRMYNLGLLNGIENRGNYNLIDAQRSLDSAYYSMRINR